MKLILVTKTNAQKLADKAAMENKKSEDFEKELSESRKPKGSKAKQQSTDGDWCKVTDNIEHIILYWQSKDGLTKMRIPVKDGRNYYLDVSKRFKETALQIKRLIAGTAFSTNEFVRLNRKFTIDEIKLAIDRFHISATSDRHLPSDKSALRRLSLKDFIYSSYYKDERYRSQFLFFIENEPQTRIEITTEAPVERMPSITKALEIAFEDYGFTMTWRVRNTFIVVSNTLYDFWVKHEKENQWRSAMSPKSLAIAFCNSVTEWWKKRIGERTVTPTLIIQPFIMKVFESYCTYAGLLEMYIEKEEFDEDSTEYDGLEYLLDLPDEERSRERDVDTTVEPDIFDFSSFLTDSTLKRNIEEIPILDEEEVNKKYEEERNRYEVAPYD